MDKNSLIKKLLNRQEVKDYTYAVFFFLVSSIFAIFAIKPALSIAFSLNKELSDLQQTNQLYENNLSQIVALQTNLEKVQDRTQLLDVALPALPQTKVLIDDIKRSASQEGLLIQKLNLADVDLKNDSPKGNFGTLSLSMETTSDFKSINNFVKSLLSQGRIKSIKNLKIVTNDAVSSNSGSLKVVLDIDAYYL